MKRSIVSALGVLLSAGLLQSQGGITVRIDVAANRHAIDPRIYGVAYPDANALSDLRVPVNRWGGNATTRYNWQLNASNRASDWYFESIGSSSSTSGADADAFVGQTKSAGAQAILTIPTIGWVANLGPSRSKLAGFSIAKYGPQTGNDWQWFPDAGNGILASTGLPISGNDPNDADVPATPAFQQGWLQHLVSTFGHAASGGVRYYILDNEPSIWFSTHRDVHPSGPKMSEIVADTVAYGTMIKSVDPGSLVMGPEEWGWSGYFFSGYDQQYGVTHGWSFLPDRSANNNWDYIPWYLNQLQQHDATTGQRLLDILSVHFYPQGGEFSNDTSVSAQQLRNRSTRALWDPNYVDESWIGTQVSLIPRLENWVSTYYPGTKVAITEYNWGAESHINGATTLADILGIFGREGLDLATYWTTPSTGTPAYNAMKLYRNYDGRGSSFGETSVAAVVPNPDEVSVFAAQRAADNALTIVAVNKDLSTAFPVTLQLANFTAETSAQAWQLTATNVITPLSDVPMSGSTLSTTLPAQSITLFVVGAAATSSGPAAIAATAGTPQSAHINATFAKVLQATVVDAGQHPVGGVSVTFTAPTSGASATFGGSSTVTAVTNASGIAISPTLSANGQTGSYAISASVSGVAASASFSLTNTPPPAPKPASIAATAGSGQSTIVSTAFATALQATVRDSLSHPLSGVTVTFTAPGSRASATFGGHRVATAVTNENGVATTPTLVANGIAGTYTVTASVAGVTTRAYFTLTNKRKR